MRRSENMKRKFTIIILIIPALIVTSTVLIQIFDSKINDFNKDIIISQGKVNESFLRTIDATINEYQYNLYEILQPEIYLSDAINTLTEQLNPQLAEIMREFKNGEITKAEYFSQQVDYYGNKHNELVLNYRHEKEEIESKISEGSPWIFWRNFLFILSLFLAFLQIYFLFRSNKNQANN